MLTNAMTFSANSLLEDRELCKLQGHKSTENLGGGEGGTVKEGTIHGIGHWHCTQIKWIHFSSDGPPRGAIGKRKQCQRQHMWNNLAGKLGDRFNRTMKKWHCREKRRTKGTRRRRKGQKEEENGSFKRGIIGKSGNDEKGWHIHKLPSIC